MHNPKIIKVYLKSNKRFSMELRVMLNGYRGTLACILLDYSILFTQQTNSAYLRRVMPSYSNIIADKEPIKPFN